MTTKRELHLFSFFCCPSGTLRLSEFRTTQPIDQSTTSIHLTTQSSQFVNMTYHQHIRINAHKYYATHQRENLPAFGIFDPHPILSSVCNDPCEGHQLLPVGCMQPLCHPTLQGVSWCQIRHTSCAACIIDHGLQVLLVCEGGWWRCDFPYFEIHSNLSPPVCSFLLPLGSLSGCASFAIDRSDTHTHTRLTLSSFV